MKSVCLCGSFKFYNQVIKIEKFLREKKIICYKPNPFQYRNQLQPSIFVDSFFSLPYTEKLRESGKAELAHLEKINKADVIYIVNPSGYIGNSVTFEIGYAYAKGKLIYSQEPIEDFAVMSLINKVMSLEDLLNILKEDRSNP